MSDRSRAFAGIIDEKVIPMISQEEIKEDEIDKDAIIKAFAEEIEFVVTETFSKDVSNALKKFSIEQLEALVNYDTFYKTMLEVKEQVSQTTRIRIDQQKNRWVCGLGHRLMPFKGGYKQLSAIPVGANPSEFKQIGPTLFLDKRDRFDCGNCGKTRKRASAKGD